MSNKDDAFDVSDVQNGDYFVDGETVAQIVLSLLHLVVAFIGVDKAKNLLSQIGVQQANAAADVAEAEKFGQKN